MKDKFAIYCTKSFYAGQGISFEAGDLRDMTGTVEEAIHIKDAMEELSGEGHWAIATYEEWDSRHRDPDFNKKSVAKVMENRAKWQNCPKPHEFVDSDEPNLWSGKKMKCLKCGFFLDENTATWYMNGRKHEREKADQ